MTVGTASGRETHRALPSSLTAGSPKTSSTMPGSGWQLESDKNFICYNITHVNTHSFQQKKPKHSKACAFTTEHHVPLTGSASLCPCCRSQGSDAAPAGKACCWEPPPLAPTIPGAPCSAGRAAQPAGVGVLTPGVGMRTCWRHESPRNAVPEDAHTCRLGLCSCGQMNTSAWRARKDANRTDWSW